MTTPEVPSSRLRSRVGAVRRLAADLGRSDTRPDALQRARRVAGRLVTGLAEPPESSEVTAARERAEARNRVGAKYRQSWAQLMSAVTGREVRARPLRFNESLARGAVVKSRHQAASALLADNLGRGRSLEQSVCLTVDAMLRNNELEPARSLCEGLAVSSAGIDAGDLGMAVLAHRRRQFDRVWGRVQRFDDETLARCVAVEAVDGALHTDTEASRARARSIAASSELSAPQLVDLAGRFLAYGERDQARSLMGRLDAALADEPEALDDRKALSAMHVRDYLDPAPAVVSPGAIAMGVIGYNTPDQDLASGNLGDYVQTIALLGNVVRFQDIEFTGEGEFGQVARELQHRVRPDLQVEGHHSRVHLVEVNREFSSGDVIPEPTWTLLFGWQMHPLYDLRYDFPYHPSIRPVFVSFHLNRLDMISDEGVEYLRRYGPIGCRDWTTVDLLLSLGVDAFFSGCLTTTVDALFGSRAEAYDGGSVVGVIDRGTGNAEEGAEFRSYTHQADVYREMSLTEGVRAAVDVLGGYQRELARAETNRLHAYLPLTSLGVPVDFIPWSSGDVRFPGLTGMTPGSAAFTEIQDGLRSLVSATVADIVDGTDESEVYAGWRERTDERVRLAKERFAAAPLEVPPTTMDLEGGVAACLAKAWRAGPHESVDTSAVTDVVVAFDERIAGPAAVTIESMVANASGPLRLWVLGRGLPAEYERSLAESFPELPVTFIPCEDLQFARPDRIPKRITISTMDRLLLPLLLADVARVVYLDVDTLVLGDVCALASIDLQGTPIAARDSNITETSEWRAAARRLPQELAVDLMRRMFLTHGHGPAALNAGVLVMDLDRMRRDDFSRTYLGWVETYGLHDQDVMLAYAGPDRVALDPRWNALPVHEDVADPWIIHWASIGKPWMAPQTYAKQTWQQYAERLAARSPGLTAQVSVSS